MLRTVVQLRWRDRILERLREIGWTPWRRLAEFGFFMVSGWVLVATAAAAAVLVPAVHDRVHVPAWSGLVALAAVGLYAAYATGLEEARRGEVVFTPGHVDQMRDVAKSLLASVGGQQGTTAYTVPFLEAQTRDYLVKQLESHHPILAFGSLNNAQAEVRDASIRLQGKCDSVAGTLDLALPPTVPPAGASIGLGGVLYLVALGQDQSDPKWRVTTRIDGRTLLISDPPRFPLDVTDQTPERIEQTKRDFAVISKVAVDWEETRAYRAALLNKGQVQKVITAELAPLAALQALRGGTRCDICDPPPPPRIKKAGPLSRLRSKRDP